MKIFGKRPFDEEEIIRKEIVIDAEKKEGKEE